MCVGWNGSKAYLVKVSNGVDEERGVQGEEGDE